MVKILFHCLKYFQYKISPPTLVQARPVTTPGTPVISDKLFGLGTPRISSTFSREILDHILLPKPSESYPSCNRSNSFSRFLHRFPKYELQ
jgi:hypothetical protein